MAELQYACETPRLLLLQYACETPRLLLLQYAWETPLILASVCLGYTSHSTASICLPHTDIAIAARGEATAIAVTEAHECTYNDIACLRLVHEQSFSVELRHTVPPLPIAHDTYVYTLRH